MNDEEFGSVRGPLRQVHESLAKVHMNVPVTAVLDRARARQRRRRAGTGFVAVAAVAGLVAGGLAVSGSGQAGAGVTQARTTAYVVQRVTAALAHENQVYDGQTSDTYGGTVTWQYGDQYQLQDYTGESCGRVTARDVCTHQGGSELDWANGTARVHGKLTGAYVTYYNKRYRLSALKPLPTSACTAADALTLTGPPVATEHWSSYIKATLACGAASTTDHVRVNGTGTTKIIGKPVTYRLPASYARSVGARYAHATWVIYVNPHTYLPVQFDATLKMTGGPRPSTTRSVTKVSWLPPTRTYVAKTLVTIPPGYHH